MTQRIRTIDLLILNVLLGWALRLPAQSLTENQLKAAYLINLAKFVEWPNDSLDGREANLTFCSLGHSPAVDELVSSVRGQHAHGHAIILKHLQGPEEVKGCHLIFLATGTEKQQKKVIHAAQKCAVLLVSENAGFAHAGGTINFLAEEGKLILEVNISAAESAGLRVSSKLLALPLVRVVWPNQERSDK